MSVTSLAVRNFRNLAEVDISPAAGINIIFGANAAGKTSLLEALFFLARVRSFRATRVDQLLTRGESSLLVRATVCRRDGSAVNVGVQWTAGATRVRVGGEDVRSLSRLARFFPIQVINAESQRLLLDGPKVRRSFLNWALFHVEHDYHGYWRRYDKALRQRNAALKLGDERLTKAWEPEFVSAGAEIDRLRRSYVAQLSEATAPLLGAWLGEEDIRLSYRGGWAQERSLEEAVEEARVRELEAGHSLVGPHRADLVFRASGMEAQHRLSRGQQKLLVIAVLLGQTSLLVRDANEPAILLIDDLPAELDEERRQQVLELLVKSGAQSFITCTDRASIPLPADKARWFHVEHGQYREVV